MLAVPVFLEIWSADGEVHERNVRVRRVVIRQMIPAVRDFADEVVVAEPLELMQLKAGRSVDVLGCQRPAFGVVEQNNARPILLFVFGLLGAQKLNVFFGNMVVLHDLHGVAVVALRPQVGNIVEH